MCVTVCVCVSHTADSESPSGSDGGKKSSKAKKKRKRVTSGGGDDSSDEYRVSEDEEVKGECVRAWVRGCVDE